MTDELDLLIDDALRSYSAQEPRAGLPLRVMAHVRDERRVVWGKWVALAMACAAMAVVFLRFHAPQVEAPRTAIAVAMPLSPVQVVPPVLEIASRPVHRIRPEPKREQFPTQAPLTDAERSLLALSRQVPDPNQWRAPSYKPLEIQAINIQPLKIDELESGETK